MGTERFYKPGSFYRIDDRTGFAFRSERTRKEWQGLIVSDRVWEARHPQDFVKGVQDNQTVPYARPRQPNTFIGNGQNAQFWVNPAGMFEIVSGSFDVFPAANVVKASDFPSGF